MNLIGSALFYTYNRLHWLEVISGVGGGGWQGTGRETLRLLEDPISNIPFSNSRLIFIKIYLFYLTRYEFTVAMHLVYRALQDDTIPDQVLYSLIYDGYF